MATSDRTAALDHVVVLMSENRSFDNLLGRPDDHCHRAGAPPR